MPLSVVSERAEIAGDQVIMQSIAIGWPDKNFPSSPVVWTHNSGKDATMLVGFGD